MWKPSLLYAVMLKDILLNVTAPFNTALQKDASRQKKIVFNIPFKGNLFNWANFTDKNWMD